MTTSVPNGFVASQAATLPQARTVIAGTPDLSAVRVGLQRTALDRTDDQALWVVIRYSTQLVGYDQYAKWMEAILCSKSDVGQSVGAAVKARLNSLPFPGVDAYAQLKAATEVFLMASCGTNNIFPLTDNASVNRALDPVLATDAEGQARLGEKWTATELDEAYKRYTGYSLQNWDGETVIPYLDVIRRRLGVPVVTSGGLGSEDCYGVLQQKLTQPTFLELIWSYWHEEGMLAQTMNALAMRFQNRRMGARDPLANLEIDPLRPLNSFLWGWVQDEQHRLSVARRAYEYDHHYGFTLHGRAVPPPRGADTRTKFLEAFHNLLFQCMKFYNEDDDTTRIADGFPVLNSLKEVHILLTEGGHNQYGDLPWNARLEMLMMQWILARPEMREFIGGRPMVAYSEPWMDRVDTMKTLQGWSDTNVMHFRDLGVFGEQILLATRFGNWNSVIQPQQAANWARYWRAEIQGYIHAYRAVTGVDLTAVPTDGRNSNLRFLPPSYHLRARLAEQQRGRALPR